MTGTWTVWPVVWATLGTASASALVRLKCQVTATLAGEASEPRFHCAPIPAPLLVRVASTVLLNPGAAGLTALIVLLITLAVASWKADHGVTSTRLSDPPPSRPSACAPTRRGGPGWRKPVAR